MPPKPRIEPILVDAAIRLFGESGYDGGTTRDVAQVAGVYEYNIYRLFKSKERLYVKALTTVVDGSLLDMKQFVRQYPKQLDKKNKLAWFLHAAIHRWYSSLSREGARMLQQVMIKDKRRRDRAFEPLASIINVVAKAIGQKKPKVNFDPKTRAESLVMALFQLKVSFADPAKNELNEMDRYWNDWIQELLPEESARRARKAAS
jgi:AcrR family transcriptional regulator